MMCPSWDQETVMYRNSCDSVQFADAQICGAPTQWWFWILAGALGVGLAIGGKR